MTTRQWAYRAGGWGPIFLVVPSRFPAAETPEETPRGRVRKVGFCEAPSALCPPPCSSSPAGTFHRPSVGSRNSKRTAPAPAEDAFDARTTEAAHPGATP